MALRLDDVRTSDIRDSDHRSESGPRSVSGAARDRILGSRACRCPSVPLDIGEGGWSQSRGQVYLRTSAALRRLVAPAACGVYRAWDFGCTVSNSALDGVRFLGPEVGLVQNGVMNCPLWVGGGDLLDREEHEMGPHNRRVEPATKSAAFQAQLLDIDAVALALGVTRRHVQRLVAERRIPFLKIGRFVRFDPSELNVWLEERRHAAPRRSARAER